MSHLPNFNVCMCAEVYLNTTGWLVCWLKVVRIGRRRVASTLHSVVAESHMAVRGFLTAFDNIDSDHDHVVSHEDLWKYAREKNMPDAFVNVSISLVHIYSKFRKVLKIDKYKHAICVTKMGVAL